MRRPAPLDSAVCIFIRSNNWTSYILSGFYARRKLWKLGNDALRRSTSDARLLYQEITYSYTDLRTWHWSYVYAFFYFFLVVCYCELGYRAPSFLFHTRRISFWPIPEDYKQHSFTHFTESVYWIYYLN